MKVIFFPFAKASGVLSGLLSRRLFGAVWGAIDDREPPRASDRRAQIGKLALALALEGALFRLVSGLVDHGTRSGFASLTGTWPGEKEPRPSNGAAPQES